MVGEPSRALPDVDFALGGRDFQGDTGRARLIGDVPFNTFAARDLVGAGQPLHHAPLARDRVRVVVVPAVRARLGGRRDRREPVRRASSAGSSRARSCSSSHDADEAVAAYRELLDDPGAGRGDGPPRARARARRAHLPPPRAPAARAARPARSARVAEERIAIVPAYNEERNIGARGRRAARVRPRARRRRRSPTARSTARPRSPPSTARTWSGCRSTSGSAAPCRPASATPGRTATSSPCAATATASTTRPSCRRCSRRCSRARPTSCVGSRFTGGDGLPLVGDAPHRHPPARARRLGDRAPARHRHDLRLPGAEPRARSASSPPTTRTTTPRSRGW